MIRRASLIFKNFLVHLFHGGVDRIAFDFGDPETERLFWESVEQERR
jgi:hypothetical protein